MTLVSEPMTGFGRTITYSSPAQSAIKTITYLVKAKNIQMLYGFTAFALRQKAVFSIKKCILALVSVVLSLLFDLPPHALVAQWGQNYS